jgi:hypothetical protein
VGIEFPLLKADLPPHRVPQKSEQMFEHLFYPTSQISCTIYYMTDTNFSLITYDSLLSTSLVAAAAENMCPAATNRRFVFNSSLSFTQSSRLNTVFHHLLSSNPACATASPCGWSTGKRSTRNDSAYVQPAFLPASTSNVRRNSRSRSPICDT